MKRVSSYLTVYLALTLGVLVTLSLALIEGVRANTLRMETMCIADIGTDSIMAEYHRALFQRFNLLAIDSSYGSQKAGRERVRGRLEYYLTQNMTPHKPSVFHRDLLGLSLQEAEIEGVSYLTDEKGAVFRRQAIKALQDDLGVTAVQEVARWMETVEKYQLDTRDVEAEKRAVDERIASYRGKEVENEEKEKEILDFDDPTMTVEKRKKTGILSQTIGSGELSGKTLNQKGLLLQRIKEGKAFCGNLPLSENTTSEKLTEKIQFTEYLMRYFGAYTEQTENSALDYELEYIIAGEDADADNLRSVLHRLLAMREAANAVYLFSDKEKYGEADLAALAVSVVLLVPELQELFRTTILLGWAYAESVYDLKILMGGGRVPLIKTKGTWHYSLANILADLWDEFWDGRTNADGREGLKYQDYLRILLLSTKEEEMTLRAMNLTEADIRQTKGNQAFRLDGCIVALQSRITVSSEFGYQSVWEEKKEY